MLEQAQACPSEHLTRAINLVSDWFGEDCQFPLHDFLGESIALFAHNDESVVKATLSFFSGFPVAGSSFMKRYDEEQLRDLINHLFMLSKSRNGNHCICKESWSILAGFARYMQFDLLLTDNYKLSIIKASGDSSNPTSSSATSFLSYVFIRGEHLQKHELASSGGLDSLGRFLISATTNTLVDLHHLENILDAIISIFDCQSRQNSVLDAYDKKVDEFKACIENTIANLNSHSDPNVSEKCCIILWNHFGWTLTDGTFERQKEAK